VSFYAVDILILLSTVSKLQELLNIIEYELQALDLAVNSQKFSSCLQIGPRCDINCSIFSNITGGMIYFGFLR